MNILLRYRRPPRMLSTRQALQGGSRSEGPKLRAGQARPQHPNSLNWADSAETSPHFGRDRIAWIQQILQSLYQEHNFKSGVSSQAAGMLGHLFARQWAADAGQQCRPSDDRPARRRDRRSIRPGARTPGGRRSVTAASPIAAPR